MATLTITTDNENLLADLYETTVETVSSVGGDTVGTIQHNDSVGPHTISFDTARKVMQD